MTPDGTGRPWVAEVLASGLHTRVNARAPAWLVACVVACVIGASPPLQAETIENTAYVHYEDPDSGTVTSLVSNTVVTEVLPVPTPAELEFRRYDPDLPDGSTLPFDGGMCQVGDSFVPLPAVEDLDGNPVDGDGRTDEAPGFYAGEPIMIVVRDLNRNADPLAREYVQVEITTSTGDAETLQLRETGPDTAEFAGAIQSVVMPPAATPYDCILSLEDQAEIVARYTDTDFPLDTVARAVSGYAPLPPDRAILRLEQTVSRQVVERGDFLQYRLVVRNIHTAPATQVRIDDVLPPGVRYRGGSLRVGAAADRLPDPEIAADGRSFSIPVGTLAGGASETATFVAEVGAGAQGPELANGAIARGALDITSNPTETVVRMERALATGRFTIIGTVTLGSCEAADAGGERAPPVGVPGVRLMMEDGTFVSTDEQGAYHFEGVRPGTHVVQLDLPSLPPGTQPVRCRQDTRFAGRTGSQFVEGQGGSLQRADFTLARKAPERGEVGVRLLVPAPGRLAIEADVGKAPVDDLRLIAMLPTGAKYVAGSATADGAPTADPQVTGNAVVFEPGDTGANWRKRFEFSIEGATCEAGEAVAKALASFKYESRPERTPAAELRWPCGPPDGGPAASDRATTTVAIAPEGAMASPYAEQMRVRAGILSDIEADGGGDVDWFEGQAPGRDWVFPGPKHNPRAPTTRVVLKYQPGDKVVLRVNGVEVPALNFDGTTSNPAKTIAIGVWRGVDLVEGDNLLQAEIIGAGGDVVATLERTVHYANGVARAELVPEQSILVADGIHNPVIAVRMLDKSGHPVRAGVTGEYSISPPYMAAIGAGAAQNRRIVGLDRAGPTWRIEGDEGIAYIELAPTNTAGSFTLGFDFPGAERAQQIEGWLKSAPRDWVVVGFAKGSVGYETLADNMEPLPEGEDGSGMRGDGQVSFYAKGRVLGQWMLTLAYDSDKPTDELQRRGLLSAIDPQQYYTLYGDDTQQGYDASSSEKLYLKLERDQFYALFGDFQTGLDRNELSRYQRVLNGVKVEYRGPLFAFNGFAAETSQNFARDELPGDGTSGLYRLTHAGLLVNSERVRIETRDRYHSERIVESRELVRHLDYDIDYDNGTLFFREPVPSRDFDLNPVFVVVDYETRGGAGEYLNAGGRASVRLMDGKLEAGATYIRDEDFGGRSRLAGVDARFRPSEADEIRAEYASTEGRNPAGARSGNAWLVEWQHRGDDYDLLAYARRQDPGFGLGQQNRSEGGMAKAGVQGRWRVDERFALQGEAYRLENLASGAVRHAARLEATYRGDGWGARAGLQWARDEAAGGKTAESRQVTLGANRALMDGRLELDARADFSLGGRNDSVDFPTRFQVGAAYRITQDFRILAQHEITDGEDRDTSTTRIGFEVSPWKNAKLRSTLNQSRISEYGPRTFAVFGLDQKFMVGEHWSFDAAIDSSRAFNESGREPLVVDPSQPIAAGGIRDGGALTEDFVAVSGGAAYRTGLWAWNARAEARHGDAERYGFTSSFLRQARDGVAFAAGLQAFSQGNADGSKGLLANAQLSWAYRPGGSRWSMLDKLEFRLDEIRGGAGQPVLGQATIAAVGDARSRRLVNNFVLNYMSDAWAGGEGGHEVLDLDQRSQLSLYYGSKYVLDSFGTDDYAGYTDILGAEWRYDLGPRLDVGLRASVLHSWRDHSVAYAFGPSLGFSPFDNAWVSVGYNLRGFHDRDFEQSHHTAKGAYLVFRLKFDQHTFGLDGPARAEH